MGKTSDWKIVATEGSTIDERTISAQWIKDMAEQYSLNEYVALIWPEHSRSSWG
ncbi:capsid protein, partial [Salinivibrio sp. VYel6]|uniref:GPO family capsid scaffolding protein n=1 Tax=Salinivibrio sp. VYel6 TaxID=2490493 RepID=UPI001561E436